MFPFLKQDFIYLDAAATSLKPEIVIEAEAEYYRKTAFNTGRGTSLHNFKATKSISDIRKRCADFIGANSADEIIFTSNTTDSINLLTNGFVKKSLTPGDNIVITQLEHHSNYLPWLELAKELGIECRIVPLKNYKIDYTYFDKYIDENTLITSITGMSNVTGEITDLQKIIDICRDKGSLISVDGAQLITHKKIDVTELDIDFLSFSAHKMYGPFGLGILYGKRVHLEKFKPYKFGGNMVSHINKLNEVHLKNLPERLEAGTQNPSALYAFNTALDFLEKHSLDLGEEYYKDLGGYLIDQLKQEGGITIYSPPGAIISFNINGVHPHDASEFFDRNKIILRAGNLCASPFFNDQPQKGLLRVSMGIYNKKEDLDRVITTIREIKEFFL